MTKKQQELQKIRNSLFRTFKSVIYENQSVRLIYTWSEIYLSQITRYIQLQHRFNPWMEFKIEITSSHDIDFTIKGAIHLLDEIRKIIQELNP